MLIMNSYFISDRRLIIAAFLQQHSKVTLSRGDAISDLYNFHISSNFCFKNYSCYQAVDVML